MEANLEFSLFLSGSLIGLLCSVIATWADYRRGASGFINNLPGCVLMMTGLLGFTGVISILLSLILTGSVRFALVIGLGVGVGFFTGFLVVFVLLVVKDGVVG